jgi:hypothetical protein
MNTRMDETDQRFTAGPSTIAGAGQGLFAAVPLAPGDALRVVGVRFAADSVADRCTRYADAYKFRVGADLLLPVGYAGLVNHCAQHPNLEKIIEGNEVLLRVTRPVAVGEELFFTYSTYAQERFGLPG